MLDQKVAKVHWSDVVWERLLDSVIQQYKIDKQKTSTQKTKKIQK